MSDKKIAGESDMIAGWSLEEINDLELAFLHKMFECKDSDGVDVTMFFAKFMSKVALNSDNYPIFLKLLQFENHWVVDALLGDKEPLAYFKPVQPNTFILNECFKMFKRWKPGGIYAKSLLILFGLLKTAYESPQDGYRTYALTITDVNNLGKHLDKDKDQKDDVNRTLLGLLDRIASLSDLGGLPAKDKQMSDVAMQANNIRGKFLDYTKKMSEAIPDEMLKREDFKKKEVAPTIQIVAGPGTKKTDKGGE